MVVVVVRFGGGWRMAGRSRFWGVCLDVWLLPPIELLSGSGYVYLMTCMRGLSGPLLCNQY